MGIFENAILILKLIISDYFVYISFKIKRIRHVFCFLRAFLLRTQKAAEYLIRSFRRFLPPGRSSLNDMQHVRTPHAAERIPGRNHNILAFFASPASAATPRETVSILSKLSNTFWSTNVLTPQTRFSR